MCSSIIKIVLPKYNKALLCLSNRGQWCNKSFFLDLDWFVLSVKIRKAANMITLARDLKQTAVGVKTRFISID